MANNQTGAVDTGFIDKRRARDHGTPGLTEYANYGQISTLRTRLNGLSATSYTTARLDSMTVNDMVYALRVASADSASI